MQSIVIGTAGHIDHGKSALVRALTGIDPDRLKEEKARGITIDLGFAHTAIGDVNVAFVDVPGHERFIRNMLAGAGGIDAVLLVVAADESVKPQTREHFEICRLLGVDRGVIAITKADLADADTLAVTALEARELVRDSALAAAAVIPVSAKTGQGLDQLRQALASLAGTSPRSQTGPARFPVDRVFTVRGFGTVVTGTLVAGRIAEGDELAVLPDGWPVRVRGVQVHGADTREAVAPRRVAVNVGAAAVSDLHRGVTLAPAGALAVTRRFDARIEWLPSARPLRHGARVRVHQGTADMAGRVAIAAVRPANATTWTASGAGEASIAVPPGGAALVRIRLDTPAVLTRGDRVILRIHSPAATVGGGTVLDPEPPQAGIRRPGALQRFGALETGVGASLRVWLDEAGDRGLTQAGVARRGGIGAPDATRELNAIAAEGLAIEADGRWFAAAHVARLADRATAEVQAFHRDQPLEAGMPRESVRERAAHQAPAALFDLIVARLVAQGVLTGGDRLSLSSHRSTMSAGEGRARTAIETALKEAGLAPPDIAALTASTRVTADVADRVLRWLSREGLVVRIGDQWFHAAALRHLKASVRDLSTGLGQAATIDVASFKERYKLSRKYAIPLLEWLDREKVTRRVGDKRTIVR